MTIQQNVHDSLFSKNEEKRIEDNIGVVVQTIVETVAAIHVNSTSDNSTTHTKDAAINIESVRNTPNRVARMYGDLLAGYKMNPYEILNKAMFEVEYDEMVTVSNIDFYSLCEHHLLPFHGKVHVGYLPNMKIVGLSKIPRIVDMYARRLQIQERMTYQIASTFEEILETRGVGVIVEACHMCTTMRGVRKPNTRMITSTMLGIFKSDAKTREEFMKHIEKSGVT